MLDPVLLLSELIAFNSVTPNEAGSMAWLIKHLEDMGLTCTPLDFSVKPGAPTRNLYAYTSPALPNLCFAGHLDVVPPGDSKLWKYNPFAGIVVNNMIHGRGAVDMKGAIACFLAALSKFLNHSNNLAGSISFLITSDEEGDGKNGTVRVVEYLKQHKIALTDCLVGEPTSVDTIADMIKIGRRGSITFTLTVTGKQGHVAYPELAENPINLLLSILDKLKSVVIDDGYANFQPSHLEITSVDVGNPISNIIPQQAQAKFNIRFNPAHNSASLFTLINNLCSQVCSSYELDYTCGSQTFLSDKGNLYTSVMKAIKQSTSIEAEVSTSGGTSDARFIKDLCPVVELGLSHKLAHHIDEAVSIDDIYKLTEIYYHTLMLYFKQ